MSETMTSNFFYAPDYKTQCISLNAQLAKVPRGTIIAVKGSVPLSAGFTGTAATIAPTARSRSDGRCARLYPRRDHLGDGCKLYPRRVDYA